MRLNPALIARSATPAGAVDLPWLLEPQHSPYAFACFTAHVWLVPAEMSEYAVPLGASLLPLTTSLKQHVTS